MSDDVLGLIAAMRQATGDLRVRQAARLMTLLENDAALFERLPDDVPRRPARVLGITGPAGVGKSTLTDALLAEFRSRHAAWTIGVIAVDPSSPLTGGAVLGDRVRMMRHCGDRHVFIRSLASRGQLGGLAAGVRGVLVAMAAYGCDLVMIETVGVGQAEVEVAKVADRVCVVLAPGQGDGVQSLKAGIMEIGDLFVVNKSDRDDAPAFTRQISAAVERAASIGPLRGIGAMHRALPQPRSRCPTVLQATASEHVGIDAIADWCQRELAAGEAP